MKKSHKFGYWTITIESGDVPDNDTITMINQVTGIEFTFRKGTKFGSVILGGDNGMTTEFGYANQTRLIMNMD